MQTILVAVDFSPVTEAVVTTAAALAQLLGSSVYLLHVVAPDPDFVGYEAGPDGVRDAMAHQFREVHRKLQELESSLLARAGKGKCVALLLQGQTVEKLLAEQARLNADLVVLGSHGHGALYNLLVGSVAAGVLRGARCPVVVVPSPRP
ncbi:universal stress protein [bacterium]|nr:universal stress protein [bacterium]PIX84361.1 MAG: universal stress protein [Nitrospirae bacterium CG_4_10_14_3_um_filter_70_108]